ncbi:ATP-grasp domain-containing protein [Paracoccaceae bacterium]|nr:ATP-grasp domain-containing protein [Paracoccaceae bacterium]
MVFKSILIANRGEIARRIIKTAKRLGIKTYAVYSEVDKNSLHVKEADDALFIGPAESKNSYLNIKKITDVAVENNVTAIHPGYGFLSENYRFAKKVEESGVKFIGPSWKSIKVMGNKNNAKKIISSANIPMVKGFLVDKEKPPENKEKAKEIGYPVIAKAAAGGGGKGMRVVYHERELQNSIEAVIREAQSSFKDDEVIVERYIEGGKHIEIQIARDEHGNCIHLFERDCSSQRRYQKVIEEAPALSISEVTKKKMYKAAIDIACKIDYQSLGTIEFIVDVQSNKAETPFFFLEMNTRLQVEHPITEEILGIDLVELQINIAQGKRLNIENEKILPRGHAIEARIYAEDPKNDFLPSPGDIQNFALPAAGRLDLGVRSGDQISTFYDPMLGKIIVHGENREEARTYLIEHLKDMFVEGIATNIDFLSYVLNSELFEKDIIQVTDLDDLALQFKKLLPDAIDIIGAALIILSLETQFKNKMWRLWGSGSTKLLLMQSEKSYEVKISSSDGQKFQFNVEDKIFTVERVLLTKKTISFDVNQRLVNLEFKVKEKIISLFRKGATFTFENQTNLHKSIEAGVQESNIVAPITGSIAKIMVKNGQFVSKEDPVLFIEAMKMEYQLVALKSGKVSGLKNKKGDLIDKGEILLE